MVDRKWFVRKLGFGLRPEEKFPTDPVSWAMDQADSVPDAVGVRTIRSGLKPEIVAWPSTLTWSLKDRIDRLVEYRSNSDALDAKYERGTKEHRTAMDELEMRLTVNRYDQLHRAHQCIYGGAPVFERFAHFWQNHFTVGDRDTTWELMGHYHQAAIKDKMLGSFGEMLYGVTTHPAMLTYLDNIYSIGPNSESGKWSKKEGEIADINENLARELMELHTISPAAGYTQQDIIELSKVLTGWGYIADKAYEQVNFMTDERWNIFRQDNHEPGRKKILGVTYGEGRAAIRTVTKALAEHPQTARFISIKLARCFIADEPDPAVISAIESVWKSSKGHLPDVHKAVIEQVAKAGPSSKLIPPEPWLYQVCRVSGADLLWGFEDQDLAEDHDYERDPAQILREAGHWFWARRQPDGFSDLSVDWTSAEHMDRRIRLSRLIYLAGKPIASPEMIISRYGLSSTVRDLVARAEMSVDQSTLLYCSKGFMEV